MARYNYRKLSAQQRQELISELLEVISAIKTKENLKTFLLQLITPSEAVMLARRWQIAKQLAAGKSYYAIAQDLEVGMTTIQSVDQWLSQAIGDYRERLEAARASVSTRKIRRTKLRVFPNTLPFLLLNLLIEGAARIWWAELEEQIKTQQKKASRFRKKR